MSDYSALILIHDCLKHKNKWYIDPTCADQLDWMEICEKAKAYADKRLGSMTCLELWWRYYKYRKTDIIVPPKESHFETFINQVLYDLGCSHLKGRERDVFADNCFLSIKFINKEKS